MGGKEVESDKISMDEVEEGELYTTNRDIVVTARISQEMGEVQHTLLAF